MPNLIICFLKKVIIQKYLYFTCDKTNVTKEMEEIQKVFNVSFVACANTMRRMNVDKSRLVPFAKIVPVAILELSSRQQEGWSYIKAGIY